MLEVWGVHALLLITYLIHTMAAYLKNCRTGAMKLFPLQISMLELNEQSNTLPRFGPGSWRRPDDWRITDRKSLEHVLCTYVKPWLRRVQLVALSNLPKERPRGYKLCGTAGGNSVGCTLHILGWVVEDLADNDELKDFAESLRGLVVKFQQISKRLFEMEFLNQVDDEEEPFLIYGTELPAAVQMGNGIIDSVAETVTENIGTANVANATNAASEAVNDETADAVCNELIDDANAAREFANAVDNTPARTTLDTLEEPSRVHKARKRKRRNSNLGT
jgi:hypothetical protein